MPAVDLQKVADRLANSLAATDLLFQLFPNPRPQGRPRKIYSPLPSAIVVSVVSAFESFAEDLVSYVLYEQGRTWAHIAKNSDLTNPSLSTLCSQLKHSAGVVVTPPNPDIVLVSQTSATGWTDRSQSWDDILKMSESWIQVRHCLSHGLTTGLGIEIWPGPVTARNIQNQGQLPQASDVLAYRKRTEPERALYFWPGVNCARVFAQGSSAVLKSVGSQMQMNVDTSTIPRFDNV